MEFGPKDGRGNLLGNIHKMIQTILHGTTDTIRDHHVLSLIMGMGMTPKNDRVPEAWKDGPFGTHVIEGTATATGMVQDNNHDYVVLDWPSPGKQHQKISSDE